MDQVLLAEVNWGVALVLGILVAGGIALAAHRSKNRKTGGSAGGAPKSGTKLK